MAHNVGNESVKIWILPVSRSYQVRLLKEIDGSRSYWGVFVESRAGKFEPIQLGCQDVPD